MRQIRTLALAISAIVCAPAVSLASTLVGWAELPAATFSDGPTSGQLISPNPYGTHLPPYADRQPVQGFSAVIAGADDMSFRFLSDNGFGTQANSADALLRLYSLSPDFHTAEGGSGRVVASDWHSGMRLEQAIEPARITLNDVNRQLELPIQADYRFYYNDGSKPQVAPPIRFGRLLTGADLDVESVRQDRSCALWFGDEFGPYLIKTDLSGAVLRSAISLPGVYAPQHKDVVAGRASANLASSGGFEGLAITPRGDRLFTLLEKPVAGDPADRLRIHSFDIEAERYTGEYFFYPLQAVGHAIGDMTAIDDTRFLVIERNGETATTNGVPFKRIYLIDLRRVTKGGVARKMELVDLMQLADPDDLNRDGSLQFSFPYVTIESVLPLDSRTLLVTNDNNFPGGGGRGLVADPTEFLQIRLDRPIVGLRDTPVDHRDPHARCTTARNEIARGQ